MNVTKIISYLPNTVKADIIDFSTVKMKTGKSAERVTLDRLLTDEEKEAMLKNKHIMGIDCVTFYRYAPEIKQSYFYVMGRNKHHRCIRPREIHQIITEAETV